MPGAGDKPYDVLKSMLAAAARMVHELLNDPLLERFLNVFERMPEGDRGTVIGALEREVQTRLVSREVADSLSHVELRPNPNAHFYLRVIEPDQQNQLEMVAFLRTANNLQRGIGALDPRWRDLVRQALQHMDPAGLEKLNTFNRAMHEILDEVMAERASSPERESTDEHPANPPARKRVRSPGG